MIYTWRQVNGVSVGRSLSFLTGPDLLFLLSLVSPLFFFLSSCLSSSLHLSSLSLERERKKSCPWTSLFKTSLSPSFTLHVSSLLSYFLSHTPTYHPSRWQAAAHPACCVLSSPSLGDQSHDSVVLITGPAFPGQDAGIFIAADKGSSKT